MLEVDRLGFTGMPHMMHANRVRRCHGPTAALASMESMFAASRVILCILFNL